VAVVGAGVFGASAALAFTGRGARVTLLDPGPLPHPLAASTDISKVVRLEYGADAAYTELADRAIEGWEAWNRELTGRGERPLYHACGVMFARFSPMAPGTFEAESERVLAARGHRTERLSGSEIARRFPLLSGGSGGGGLVEGLYNPRGGFAEAERAMAFLIARARAAGVVLRAGSPVASIEGGEAGPAPVRVGLAGGDHLDADQVLVCAGAWTRFLLPETAGQLQATAQPIFHLGPEGGGAERAAAPHLPVFGADISTTGYYGFPAHPVSGVVKIGRHSGGRALHPGDTERAVDAGEDRDLRQLLERHLPALAAWPLRAARTCFYSDTRDGHFLIDALPGRPRVMVATGDSGHAFKFAPVLGELLCDLATGGAHPLRARFGWRPDGPGAPALEASRHRSA
jgi:glycine/D-amino acid oxidase-like deaminating enzyme